LESCSPDLSLEHYVSRSLSEIIQRFGGLQFGGLPSLNGRILTNIPPARVAAARILCTAHNNALSGLDAVAARLFGCLQRITADLRAKNTEGQDRVFLFNGNDIERWMLKCLCGLVAAGAAMHENARIPAVAPPREALELLFGLGAFPPRWGFYFHSKLNQRLKHYVGVSVHPLIRPPHILGVTIELLGLRFSLVLAPTPDAQSEPIRKIATYRPSALIFSNGRQCSRRLLLCWDGPSEGQVVLRFPGTPSR
jgi:hypothetical protein